MSPQTAAFALIGIVLISVLVGAALRARQGRARRRVSRGDSEPAAAALGLRAEDLGARATLVQFSTELCARCPATRRLLGEVAGAEAGVRHADIDLTHRPDLARRFAVRQTPTVLVLDGGGVERSRMAGAPSRATVLGELEGIGGIHV
ncbi:thioredoxin family protein [Microbacterium sp. Marseille-Q6965]|uniref:thioredoxin family protein n=1 Tax=Microbacterium sp. Marseille-Q6965 TaxID=2965072 RepID=UPI0021B76A6A|nr:thioredoxin family protein [Microbacterium sp. Marseille-Q6965]